VKVLNPEPLTHAVQELYTRPHAGSGLGSPDITRSLAKLRGDEIERQHAKDEPAHSESENRMEPGGNGIPMEVHPPRHKDMDPNHPDNVRKMKSKFNEYIPYPSPDGISYKVI
jgi:hypothetical protein